jgi:hypothetical protein
VPITNDRSFNRSVIGAVIAALIIVAVAAYVLAAVVRTSSRDPTQNSVGTMTDDALPFPFAPRFLWSVC